MALSCAVDHSEPAPRDFWAHQARQNHSKEGGGQKRFLSEMEASKKRKVQSGVIPKDWAALEALVAPENAASERKGGGKETP
ncbi:hypothetical protein AOLI_G00116540 [Acnodon oligacanthus]